MKVKILMLVLIFCGLVSCNSQNADNGKNKKLGQKKPHEDIRVKKKYDEKGNLIEFDSTYTSYYSDFEGDTINQDSIMSYFPMFFNQNIDGILSDHFFQMDSSFYSMFFKDGYFENEFFNQDKNMLKMMQRMDSLKNEFFKENAKKK